MNVPLHELPPGAMIMYTDVDGVEKTFDPNPKFKVGDRFLSRDKRDGGRVVEIVAVIGIDSRGAWDGLSRALFGTSRNGRTSPYGRDAASRAEYIRQRGTRYWARNVTSGRTVKMQENTLRDRFTRQS